MKATLGVLALAFGGGACVVGITSFLLGLQRKNDALLAVGRKCVAVLLVSALAAVGIMEWALVSHDFTIRYVAENNARSTPLLFTITGLWSALAGSILLWVLILSGYIGVTVRHFRKRASEPLVIWATIVMLGVALFFFLLVLGPANPFRLVAGGAPLDGRGPNPLLQNHPLMAFHPPMLYLGYVGFTVPFAFAMSSLITGSVGEGWLADTRRTTLIAWGFLSLGIILGAWWSYEVLGWGGYWAWDPVENASLLPWLTATAFIHSVMVQERRAMLRVWNLSLVIATFCLTILGTFLTRSGVVNSVHAFSESSIGLWLLVFLGVCAGAGLALIAWRGDRLRAPGRIDSILSREAAFLGNNLLFVAFAFVVLLGTVFPLIVEAIQGKQLSVGEPYFNRMTIPLGLALLFLMAVAPALPWRAASGDVLKRRLLLPAWVGTAVMVLTLIFLDRSLPTALAFGLGAFAIAGIMRETFMAVKSRRRAEEISWMRATGRTLAGNPRRYGGLTVHVGVVLIAVAIAGSHTFGIKQEIRLAKGQSAEVAGYTFTYVGSSKSVTGQKTTLSTDIRIDQGGKSLGTYAPSVSTFPNSNQAIGTPSVRTGVLRDIYLTLISSPNKTGRVTIGVGINPMVVWIWFGGALLAIGTIGALLPSVRRRPGLRVTGEAAVEAQSVSVP
ncbi:MAG: heme lyase CcmF/NrfE family subunit [Actinomycetes bacterium]